MKGTEEEMNEEKKGRKRSNGIKRIFCAIFIAALI
jgi:hypothetical protein